MPTKPTIPKDLILKNALELLIAEGYEKVNSANSSCIDNIDIYILIKDNTDLFVLTE